MITFIPKLIQVKSAIFFYGIIIFLASSSACTSNKAIVLYDKKPDNISDIATLIVPIEIDVVYNDGTRTKFLPSYQELITYKLLPGKHLLGFRYQDLVINGDGNNESIKSRTVMIQFDAKPGEKYTIDFTPPKTTEEALPLEKTLELSIRNQNKIIATSYPAPESPATNWFSAKPFDAENLAQIESKYSENSIVRPPATDASNTQHLHYWWTMATPEEKKNFKIWLDNN